MKTCDFCGEAFPGKTNTRFCCVTCDFVARIEIVGECWEWLGEINHGYGRIRVGGKKMRAHRVAFWLANGLDPGELLVCHTCDNKKCVNPLHLYIGTNQDNSDDAVSRGRTTRGDGHPKNKLTPEQVAMVLATAGQRGSGRRLARQYGVSPAAISAIRHGKNWKHFSSA